MTPDEWLRIGVSSGAVKMPETEEKTFEELYKLWFKMKMNVIRAQSCDRIEVTYNRYYAGSALAAQNVSMLDENAFIRFLTGIIAGRGNITAKEFARIFQIANNVMSYARYLNLGGARLLDWEMVRRYVPEGKIMPELHQDFAVPKADMEKLLELVIVQDIYPLKRSACLCLVLNFFLGLRVGELASLTWQDIDLERKAVRICKTETKAYNRDEEGNRDGAMVYRVVEETKTVFSVREVPLLPEAVYILEQLRAHHDRCGYQGRCLAYDGKSTILVRSLDRTLRKLCQYCNIRYFNTHMIRKTFATMLHASGMPTRYISDLLGHSDMVTTEKNYILTYRDNYDTLLGYMHQGLDFRLKEGGNLHG